eukprot:m.245339 g.245339  ORF g.245339 m.245339 type:complete len:197 (-) comp17468_c0_seq25:2577-3167(-)
MVTVFGVGHAMNGAFVAFEGAQQLTISRLVDQDTIASSGNQLCSIGTEGKGMNALAIVVAVMHPFIPDESGPHGCNTACAKATPQAQSQRQPKLVSILRKHTQFNVYNNRRKKTRRVKLLVPQNIKSLQLLLVSHAIRLNYKHQLQTLSYCFMKNVFRIVIELIIYEWDVFGRFIYHTTTVVVDNRHVSSLARYSI